MLKGIPHILSTELLKVLCEMGHSATIVIADGNFTSETIGKDSIVIRADGYAVPKLHKKSYDAWRRRQDNQNGI